jgi:hypothetical protein
MLRNDRWAVGALLLSIALVSIPFVLHGTLLHDLPCVLQFVATKKPFEFFTQNTAGWLNIYDWSGGTSGGDSIYRPVWFLNIWLLSGIGVFSLPHIDGGLIFPIAYWVRLTILFIALLFYYRTLRTIFHLGVITAFFTTLLVLFFPGNSGFFFSETDMDPILVLSVFCSFFYLMRYVKGLGPRDLVLFLVSCCIALFSKETTYIIPAYAALVIFKRDKRLFVLPLLVLGVVLALRFSALGGLGKYGAGIQAQLVGSNLTALAGSAMGVLPSNIRAGIWTGVAALAFLAYSLVRKANDAGESSLDAYGLSFGLSLVLPALIFTGLGERHLSMAVPFIIAVFVRSLRQQRILTIGFIELLLISYALLDLPRAKHVLDWARIERKNLRELKTLVEQEKPSAVALVALPDAESIYLNGVRERLTLILREPVEVYPTGILMRPFCNYAFEKDSVRVRLTSDDENCIFFSHNYNRPEELVWVQNKWYTIATARNGKGGYAFDIEKRFSTGNVLYCYFDQKTRSIVKL